MCQTKRYLQNDTWKEVFVNPVNLCGTSLKKSQKLFNVEIESNNFC